MARTALRPYTFADGTHLPRGGVVSVASQGVHTDAAYYTNPECFDPWRFADIRDEDGEGVRHQLVATGCEYVPFGHGRHAWWVPSPPSSPPSPSLFT